MEMTYSEWEEKYKPMTDVNWRDYPLNRIWTSMDRDEVTGESVIISGFHWVNASYRIVTEVAYDGDEELIII